LLLRAVEDDLAYNSGRHPADPADDKEHETPWQRNAV